MKYQTGKKVLVSNIKCIIIANKEEPYKPKTDPFMRAKIYPEKDYLLFIFKEIDNNEEVYSGLLDVLEHEIIDKEWTPYNTV